MSGAEAAGPQPVLSVVVAAMSGSPYLERCLAALAAQLALAVETSEPPCEIIVVGGEGRHENLVEAHQIAALVREQYPWAQFLHCPAPVTLAQLRARGIGHAAGEIIAITEDHCIPAADWCTTLISAHRRQDAGVIGGAVDNAANRRRIDWAAYWCEYSPFASPAASGPVTDLAAANVSYKRAALAACASLRSGSYHEGAVHAELSAGGVSLWSEPQLRVWHNKHFTLRSYCRERFAYSRWYAGERRAQMGGGRRLLHLAATPLLPMLLLLRLLRRTRGHAGEQRRFVGALPYLLLFVCVWAVGEAAGLLWGPGAGEYELR